MYPSWKDSYVMLLVSLCDGLTCNTFQLVSFSLKSKECPWLVIVWMWPVLTKQWQSINQTLPFIRGNYFCSGNFICRQPSRSGMFTVQKRLGPLVAQLSLYSVNMGELCTENFVLFKFILGNEDCHLALKTASLHLNTLCLLNTTMFTLQHYNPYFWILQCLFSSTVKFAFWTLQ